MNHADFQMPSPRQRDCPVCLGPHDDEIHQATASVREWFRTMITRYLQ